MTGPKTMGDAVLVINAGSSSVKFGVYLARGHDQPLMKGKVAGIGRAPELSGDGVEVNALGSMDPELTHEDVVHRLLNWLTLHDGLGQIIAVGHRVVHGGTQFADPILLTDEVIDQLGDLSPLAPSHQPHNVAAIRAVASWNSDLAQVACFDTGFHQTQPALTRQFALPQTLSDAGVLRYGFHGMSYDYISSALPDEIEGERVIVAHLGNGASLCAMQDRRSVATTMGFSALDGLMMGRRCGAIDPGVLIYLQRAKGMSLDEIEELLYRQSGLLGVSGVSNAMQVLEGSDDPAAGFAIDMFCFRAASELAKLIPALGGLDSIVFTAGIGENSSKIRAKICENLAWLGIELSDSANQGNQLVISTPKSRICVGVMATNEEAIILRDTRQLAVLSRHSEHELVV